MSRTAVHAAKPAHTNAEAPNVRAEREADSRARSAERRLGLPSRPATTPQREPHGPNVVPTSAAAVARRSGTPLPPATRRSMEHAFGHDFGHVRVHSGRDAARAAASVDAAAFTLGSHVVLPRANPTVLAHELGHVVGQDTGRDRSDVVRRVSAGESFLRFFGGGTIQDFEVDAYIARLLEPNATIEDQIDSDDKARAVVDKGKHKDLPLAVRKLLIDEMISGVTGDDDEKAILKILDDAPLNELQKLIDMVGRDNLDGELQGEENDELKKIFAKITPAVFNQPVPLDWRFQYGVSGATEVQSGPQGVLLDLAVTPSGSTAPEVLAKNEEITGTSAQQLLLRTAVPHPRDTKGEANADFSVGPVQDGRVKPMARAKEPVRGEYPPIDILNKSVTIELHVNMEAKEVGSDTESSEASTERSKTGEDTKETKRATEKADITTDSSETTDTKRKGVKKGTTSGKETGQERQHEDTKEDTDTDSSTTESGSRKSTETKDETATTTGTEKSVSIGGKISGELTAEIKGAIGTELHLGVVDLIGKLIPLGSLSKGLGDKILGLTGKGASLLPLLGDDDKAKLNLTLEGGMSFKIGGEISGEIAKKWIDSETVTKGTNTVDETTKGDSHTKGSEHKTGSADRVTDSEKSQKGRSTERSNESEHSEKRGRQQQHEERESEETTVGRKDSATDTRGNKTGDSQTRTKLVPVIKDASLSFKVQ